MDLQAIQQKAACYAIGLSGGSSCVGIGGALVRIKRAGSRIHIKLVRNDSLAYAPAMRTRLLAPRKEARELGVLDFALGELFADLTEQLLDKAKEECSEVDFVASDGHCVAHVPPRGSNSNIGSLSLGNPAIIARRIGVPVISGFQSAHMAAGNHKAPTHTFGDWLMFAREDRTIVSLHLGGVTRMAVIPSRREGVFAFDVGPGTLAIDGAMRHLTSGNKDMDLNGEVAAKGVVIDEFLDYLLEHPYFGRVPPKSVAHGEFGQEVYLRDALAGRREHRLEDLMATVTAAVAYSIGRAYTRFVKPQFTIDRFILSGGGVHNKTLVQSIKSAIPDTVIRTADQYQLSSAAVDPMGVALLGHHALCGLQGIASLQKAAVTLTFPTLV